MYHVVGVEPHSSLVKSDWCLACILSFLSLFLRSSLLLVLARLSHL